MRSLLRTLFDPPPANAALAPDGAALIELGQALKARARHLASRSLAVHEVSIGSCGGYALEIEALTNAVYDVERFGIRFVASPRHADVLLVSGPVTRNMKSVLERIYAAAPDPKWVVAVGDDASGSGVFSASDAVVGSVADVIPVDLHIRGCPPRPLELLKGLIALMDLAASGRRAAAK